MILIVGGYDMKKYMRWVYYYAGADLALVLVVAVVEQRIDTKVPPFVVAVIAVGDSNASPDVVLKRRMEWRQME